MLVLLLSISGSQEAMRRAGRSVDATGRECGPGKGPAEIIVDHLDSGPAQSAGLSSDQSRAVDERNGAV
jgi:hypothetical protein